MTITPEDFGIPKKRSFSIGELARIFSVSQETIRRLLDSGRINGIRVGRQTRIPHAEVVRYFERQQA